jgi:hypothetical protein
MYLLFDIKKVARYAELIFPWITYLMHCCKTTVWLHVEIDKILQAL